MADAPTQCPECPYWLPKDIARCPLCPHSGSAEEVGGQPGSPSPNPPSADYAPKTREASNFTLHRQPKIVTGGFVGVPREGEEVCSACNGTGHDPEFPRDRFGGCDICEGTGVRPVSNPSNEWKGNQIDEL